MSSWPRLLCCLFLCFSSGLAVAQAKTHHHRWEIGYQFKSPDCVCKLAFTINCQTPGPTIRATQGDTVVFTVTNSLLTENVAIHWHGIRQLRMLRIGTPWADGTEGVTQCPILPGDTFTYRFVVDRPGTYMYHMHYDMQHSAGLNGMIVVAVPPGQAEPFAYDREHHVLHDDRWNRSTYEQAATGLASVPLVCIGQIPGPTIRTVQGNAADVTVKNSPLTEHVAIHWHGIREIGTPLADGKEGVMQSPVQPGDTFMVDHLARYDMQRTAALSNTQAAGAAAAVPLFNAGEPAQHLSSSVRACFNYSRISDATRAGCSPPPAFAVAASGRDHIVTSLSDLNSGSLFDWIIQLGTGSLFLIRVMQVALNDQRKKNRGGVVAMALLILLLVIPAPPNTAMAARQFHDGGHDQAAAGPVDAAPGLMPQTKVAADHSACTSDPNTPDPHRCVHHKNITT